MLDCPGVSLIVKTASRQVAVLGTYAPENREENKGTVLQCVSSDSKERMTSYSLKEEGCLGLFMPRPLGPRRSVWGAGRHSHSHSHSFIV